MTDTLQPNVLTVASDGTIGADFTGKVHAVGLDLDAGITTTPPSQDSIRWLRTSDGTVIADIVGWEFGTTDQLVLDAYATATARAARVDLNSHDITGHTSAVSVQSGTGNPSGGAQVNVTAGTDAATQDLILLTDLGASNWLRLLSAQQLQLAFGGPTPFVYPGGTNQSNGLVVAHNIGRLPQLVLALPNGAYGPGQAPAVSCSAFGINTATFVQTLPVGVNPAPGNFGNLFWAVVG